MSFIKDTFFGGAEKKAAKAQQQAIEKGIEATNAATAQARNDLFNLFPQAQQSSDQGFQGALDVFSQSLPAQVQAFQGGNVAAQEQLLAGLPLFQSAILGGNVDYSQLQPAQVQTPDLGFFNQQLPNTIQAQTNASMNGGLGAFTPDNPIFNGVMGPFQTASNPEFIPRAPGDTYQNYLNSQKTSTFGGLGNLLSGQGDQYLTSPQRFGVR